MLNGHDILLGEIAKNDEAGIRPKLLLHCCCAPCSSSSLEVLFGHFDIACYFYNPNITDEAEYFHRLEELKKFVLKAYNGAFPVLDGGFDPHPFLALAKGKEDLPEGGARCFACYGLRLSATLSFAEKNGFQCFATTLTVSPHKNAEKLNEIGLELSKNSTVRYIPTDFKKKGGYHRSIELSREYGLYRQNYCGCEFSLRSAAKRAACDNGGEKT